MTTTIFVLWIIATGPAFFNASPSLQFPSLAECQARVEVLKARPDFQQTQRELAQAGKTGSFLCLPAGTRP
jgi:hypothetical protein